MNLRFLWGKGASGFSANSTAEEVTHGIDATGFTAIVTGGASGIGAETARVLALRGAHVIIGDKNLTAGQETRESILKQIPSAKVDVKELDLSSMNSVRNFAAQFISTCLPLNLLINNAGVMGVPYKLSVDNIELHFAINHVGHFLLTDLLLDTMKQTAQESMIEGRIVNVASMAHFTTYPEGIRFDKINEEASYGAFLAYRVSKLATILHANELARRLKEEGANVTANSLHPGAVKTPIADHYPFMETIIMRFVKMISVIFIKDVRQGAATTCYVALHPQVRGVSGKYFSDCNLSTPRAQATDMDLAKKLWDFTSNLINYGALSAYRVSKLANILHANELSRRLREEGANVTANSLHPGLINTKIVDHLPPNRGIFMRIVMLISLLYLKSVPQGAATTCYVALHPQVEGVSGQYFVDCNLAKPCVLATDINLAKKLWDFTCDLVKCSSARAQDWPHDLILRK